VERVGGDLFKFAGALRGFIVLGALMASAPPASAVTATLTDDASLSATSRAKNPPGAMPSLHVGGEGGSVALVKFDLAVLPDGITGSGIAKATLKLWVSRVQGTGSLGIERVEEAWHEATLGAAAPPRLGSFEAEHVAVTESLRKRFLVVDVTRAVRDWIDGAAQNEGLALVPASAGTAIVFDSKENSVGAHEPELDITLEWRSGPPPDNQYLGGPSGPEGPSGPAGLPGLTGPPGTALNPLRLAARRWYKALQTGVTAATGSNPSGIVFDGSNLWVANHGSGTITRHRAIDGALQATVSVGSGPAALAFDGVYVWVANQDDDTVTRVRASDGVPQGTFAVGATPSAIAFDGFQVWVACTDADSVTRLRASDGAVLGTHTVGDGPAGIAYDGSSIWVTNSLDATVSKLGAVDGALIGTYPAGTTPVGVAFDGTSLWIASRDSDSVLKLSASDGSLLGIFPVGVHPVALSFDGESLWVVNSGSDTVTRLLTGDGSLTGSWPVGSAPQGIAFDGIHVWVTNDLGDSISKL